MLSIIAIGGRVVQLILSVAILGLAANAIAIQVYQPAPVTPRYVDFVGAFGIIVAFVGVASLFIQRMSPKIPMGLDALMALFFLSAGIAWAVGLKGIHCNSLDDSQKMLDNELLNQGTIQVNGQTAYGIDGNNADEVFKNLSSHCNKSFANEILNFIATAVTLGMIGLDFVLMRKGGTTTSYV